MTTILLYGILSKSSYHMRGVVVDGQSAAKHEVKTAVCKYNDMYLVYSDGRLQNRKTGRFLKGKIDSVGYPVYSVQIVGRKTGRMLYAHRLVAEHFIPNPDNLPYVNHIDENKLNSDVSNLEWVDAKENARKFRRNNSDLSLRRCEPICDFNDLPGEEWRIIPMAPDYEVSNMGRVKSDKSGRLLRLDHNQKYLRIAFSPNTRHHYYIHRLVWCVFNDCYDLDGYVIDHLNSDVTDNRLENLERITITENNLRRFRKKPTS